MNIVVALNAIKLLTDGIYAGLAVIKEIRNNTDSTSESKQMMNERIDKIKKEVEDYFKDLK